MLGVYPSFTENPPACPPGETISSAMTWFSITHLEMENEAEPAMNSRITDNSEQIDRKTSRSICEAVGERLQQDLRPEASRFSSHIEHLMDELRRRDNEGRLQSSN
jgi:hypothetical protein